MTKLLILALAVATTYAASLQSSPSVGKEEFTCEMEGVCPVKETREALWMTPSVREYTCEECIQGMNYVEALMKDPLFMDMMVLRLKQSYCYLQDNEAKCQADVEEFFPSMHSAVVNHFLNPVDICAGQPACQEPTEAP